MEQDRAQRRRLTSPNVSFKMEPNSSNVVDLKSVIVERKSALDQALDSNVESMPYKMISVTERMFQQLSAIGGSSNDCLKLAMLCQSFAIPDWRCIEAAIDSSDVQTVRNVMVSVQQTAFPRCRRGGGGGFSAGGGQFRGRGRGRGGRGGFATITGD
eukprot:Lankesteria_metandrocarpae@DN10797_c0_g1_i1.p1